MSAFEGSRQREKARANARRLAPTREGSRQREKARANARRLAPTREGSRQSRVGLSLARSVLFGEAFRVVFAA
jgi:hypothetical protein